MPVINTGDKVRLLSHKDKAEYEVHGVQFIYSDFEKGEGELHVRLLTKAHKLNWYALAKISDVKVVE